MPAGALNCPMCGAAAATDAACCDHCGARLATVACPSCFGTMFVGEKFCSHCGARAERLEIKDDKPEVCPRCNVTMNSVVVGKSPLHECPRCEGIWITTEVLRQICDDREQQSAVLGVAAPLDAPDPGDQGQHAVHYIKCPVCGEVMNRANFAHRCHVIVDVCGRHGTWFDRDELRRILEFIQGGGLNQERELEIDDLKELKRRLG